MILVCFLAGLLARTRAAKRLMGWLEESILIRIPGYAMIRSIAHGWLGHQKPEDFKTVLVRQGDSWQIGFAVERMPDGRVVVFVPEAPEAASGAVLLLEAGRVQTVDLSVPAALKCLKRFGAGASAAVNP